MTLKQLSNHFLTATLSGSLGNLLYALDRRVHCEGSLAVTASLWISVERAGMVRHAWAEPLLWQLCQESSGCAQVALRSADLNGAWIVPLALTPYQQLNLTYHRSSASAVRVCSQF